MTDTAIHSPIHSQLIDDDITLSMTELCHCCGMSHDTITAWVFEGVLQPQGEQPQEWRFSGPMLRRARLAQHLAQEMEVNPPVLPLAPVLLERTDTLQAQLTPAGHFPARS